jgi:Zn-dependent peptidase ImmA (M78 family)
MMKKRPNRPLDPEVLATLTFDREVDATALDTPERIVEYFRRKGFIGNGCTSIETAIAENSDLELVFEDLGEADAYIVKLTNDRFRIAVNSSHHKNRQRFSMAHEYAHYQLHRDQIGSKPEGERILFRNSERNSVEYEANRVAGEILMPEAEFIECITRESGEVHAISRLFNVSPEAVRVRASQLGWAVK